MAPAWPPEQVFPVPQVVVTTTLSPAPKPFTFDVRALAATVEVSALGAQVKAPASVQTSFAVAFVMSTLELGSSSHDPGVPLGAVTLTTALGPTLRILSPDVSTQ